jgi:hypothetical protein
MLQRGQMVLVCASQCCFSTKAFFHLRKSKLYSRAWATSSRSLAGDSPPIGRQRVHADAEQHLVLDDVADPGENVLVEQGVADQHVRRGAQLFQRQRRAPFLPT